MTLETTTADFTADARGSACPGPILEAKKGISKVKKGQILEVLASDKGTKNDLPIWVKRVGHELLGILDEEGYFRIYIKRMK